MNVIILAFFGLLFLRESWDWYLFAPHDRKYVKVGRIGLALTVMAVVVFIKDYT